MRKIIKISTLIGIAVLSITLSVLGIFLPKTETYAETAVDYMENLQALTYTTTVNGEEISIKYRLWIPEDYDETKSYPMITMIHGHGAQGDDNITQINVFKPLLAKLTTLEQQASNPCIIIIPQCRLNHKWVEVSHWTGHYSTKDFAISPDLQAVVNLQNEIIENYSVDEERQCVTGHSMGGLATWDLASRFPTRYAAILPIAGAGNDLEAAKNLTNVNVWATHGALDPVVGVDVSVDMVNAIKNAGGWVRYTEYPDMNHSTGTHTYRIEDDVVNFFMTAKRGVKSDYVDDYEVATISPQIGGKNIYFYNTATVYNSNATRDWNGMHVSSFDALSVNLPSTTNEDSVISVKFPFANENLNVTNGALRIRIETLVKTVANEALRFDLIGSTTTYMTTGSKLYLVENGITTTLTSTGSGTGASTNVVQNGTTLNGYLIIPMSTWNVSATGITALNIRTNPRYAKNVWNFGEIEFGTYVNGTFTASKSLWKPFNDNGEENAYTVDSGVDAVVMKANTVLGVTNTVWAKSSFNTTASTIDISKYDGIRLYVDNSKGSNKKSMQIYMYSTETAVADIKPATGWQSNYGLAYFTPDSDCTAFKNSFAYRSSFVPVGFKGEVYIPFTQNSQSEAGCFNPRENAPTTFPTTIHNQFLFYFNVVEGEVLGIENLGLVVDDTAYMKKAFETTTSVNLSTSNDKTVMVQSGEKLQSQFEYWGCNESKVSFAVGNQANEEFLGGSALALYLSNLNDSPFVFSIKLWNNYGDIVALGANTITGQVKFISDDGETLYLTMNNGYIKIPSYAKGTLILPYVGCKGVTTAVGGDTSYALGYPVKAVFRLIFGAFDPNGEASFLLGRVGVINGDGTCTEIKIGEKGIAEVAATSEDGTYKKERANIAYSGAVKNLTVSHENHDNATITENATNVVYGQKITYTVSGLLNGDNIAKATLNGKDVTNLLVNDNGIYTFNTVAKENLIFAVVLDSDPEDFTVTVNVGENGTASKNSEVITENEQFSVTFTPNSYYKIGAVKVNGVLNSSLNGNVLTIVITENTQIDVTFEPIDYTVTYNLDGGVNNTENITTFNVETSAFTLLPATKAGYKFVGWYVGEEKVTVISLDIINTLSLTAKWEKESYTIGYTINTNQGTISPAKLSADYGEQLTYMVTPKDGYTLKEIKVNGQSQEHTNGQFEITVNENLTIEITFEAIQNTPTEPEKESGCNSSINNTGIAIFSALALVSVTLLKKKQSL